jgi:hypothetical protein
MRNVPVLQSGAIPDSMTAQELLTKAAIVFHSNIKRVIRHQ